MTDRVWHPYSLGRERIADAIEMILIARGIDREQLAREPGIFSIINSNSPLRLDGPMLQGMTEMALHAQPIVMTPFTLSGAMAPATIAGALAEQNAEALAGITYMQVVAPGCPVHVWRLHLQCRYEDRRARLRHARIYPRGHGGRAARPALQDPLPLLQRLRRQCGGCPGGL